MEEKRAKIDPKKSALLVMDYQVGIVKRLLEGDKLVARVSDALRIARDCGLTVSYVRVALEEADYQKIPETNKSFSMATTSDHMDSDTPETAIDPPDVTPKPEDIVVRKVRVGAFSTTDLDKQLRDKGIDTIILAGISTSGVVLSTVRTRRIMIIEFMCLKMVVPILIHKYMKC